MPYDGATTRRTAANAWRPEVGLHRSRVPAGRRSNPTGHQFGLSSWFSKAVSKVKAAVAPPAAKAAVQVVQAVATGQPVPTKVNITAAPIQSLINIGKGAMASGTGSGKVITKTYQAVSGAAGRPLSTSEAARGAFGISRRQYNIGRSVSQAATVVGAAALTAGAAVAAAPLLGGGAAAAPAAGAAAPAAGAAAPAAGAGVTGLTGTITAATGAASAVGAAVKPIRQALGVKPLTPENYLPSPSPQPAPVGISVPPVTSYTATPSAEPAAAAASPVEAGLLEGLPTWAKAAAALTMVGVVLKMIGGGTSPRKARA